jgi:hypothetical protein
MKPYEIHMIIPVLTTAYFLEVSAVAFILGRSKCHIWLALSRRLHGYEKHDRHNRNSSCVFATAVLYFLRIPICIVVGEILGSCVFAAIFFDAFGLPVRAPPVFATTRAAQESIDISA